ncbi:MAG: hypothetical protein Q9213_004116 [Squamulea squamosa]
MSSPKYLTVAHVLLAPAIFQLCSAVPPLSPSSTTPDCSCYQAAGNREALFLNHQFFDFRSLDNETFASNLTAPAAVDDSQDRGIEPFTSPFFDTGFFGDYFTPASWTRNASEAGRVPMVNSHQNVYLTRDSPGSPVHLTLRTNRLSSFQSIAGLQTPETAYLHASLYVRARVAGPPGACAGMFTYLTDQQESDIEILTRDERSTIRATNQPGVDPNGQVIPEAFSTITIPQSEGTATGSWTDWNDYQLNWLPGRSEWLINGISRLNKTYGVPTQPSNLQIRMWSDGSAWTGNMTVDGLATLDIEWIDLVYNTSREAPGATCKTNDPNGMFLDANGVYHLYYQYNPTDIVAGNQHWGHATSRDLYTWENQPIAIYPGAEGEGIFSGSSVIDVNNTSGFFPNQTNGVVAFYTLNTAEEESQEVAYSRDGGYTFTKYANNPVISINSTQFRDPKVTWYPATQQWVMVVAYAQEFTIGFYTSPNLTTWTHASNFSHYGFLGLQYECPNLVQIPMLSNISVENPLDQSNVASSDMFILQISINPGAPLGGSIAQYFPGTFNGTHFTPVDNAARLADFGKDNYAGQFFYGIPATSPQISIAWASNWQYAQVVPTGQLEGFRSAMSLPRYNVLANTTRGDYTLVSLPYDLSPLYSSPSSLANSTSLANSSILYDYSSTVPSGAITFNMKITSIPLANVTGTANFTFMSSVTGESIRGGFFLGGDTPFFIDRGYIRGFENPFFTDKFSTNNLVNTDTQTFRLQVVIDRSILEVFLDNGLRSATTTFFAEGLLDTLIISTRELNPGVQVSAEVFGLNSAWAPLENMNGTVAGNVTMSGQRVRRNTWGHISL